MISTLQAQKLEYDKIYVKDNIWKDTYFAVEILELKKVKLYFEDYNIVLKITNKGEDYLTDGTHFYYVIAEDEEKSKMLIQFFKEQDIGIRLFFQNKDKFQFINSKNQENEFRGNIKRL